METQPIQPVQVIESDKQAAINPYAQVSGENQPVKQEDNAVQEEAQGEVPEKL